MWLSVSVVAALAPTRPLGPYATTSRVYTVPALDATGHRLHVFWPSNASAGEKFPLVPYLHGYLGGGLDILAYYDLFHDISSYGFVVAAPAGCSTTCDDRIGLPYTSCGGLPAGPDPYTGSDWTHRWSSYYAEGLKTIEFVRNASASGDPAGPWELAWADVLDGPVRQATPAIWAFENGTVVALFAGGGLLRSADGAGWRGPYARWGAGDALYWGCPGGGEDPFLWVDARGRWHCLFHAPPYENLTRAGGHAFSADGARWAVSPEPAYRGDAVDELPDAGGAAAPRYLAKRERPHLLFGADGAPVALSTGVCEVAAGFDPATDPWGEARWAACNDNPWPGYFDRTFTHVQPIGP